MNQQAGLETSKGLVTNVNNRRFGLRDKMGYLFGDFGNDFFFILASSFLMVFYTDVYGISAAAVGGLFLIARLWDAVADVTWGRFIDTRKAGPKGKFKPWIFRMSFPLVVTGVLMFVHIPGMSDGFYLAYAFVTYILWGTLYSTVNIPYGSMASVITSDPVERTSLSTFRSLGASLAGLIINVVGPLIIFVDNKADANRFFLTAVIFAILSLSCYMACYSLSTERITSSNNSKVKTNFRATLKGFTKNKPLIWILIASLAIMTCFMLTGAVNVYLFKDYFGSAKALSMMGLIQTATIFITMPLIKPLVARFGKKETASAGLLLAAIVYALLYFMPNLSVNQFIGVMTVASFGTAFFNMTIWAFVTDVIDYHEYLTGLREDGTVYSVYSFARKVGQAIAGGLSGFAISAVGYNAGLKSQSQDTLQGVHTLATLLPAVMVFIVFLILVFLYPLNKKRTLQLATDLTEKRSL
ncbi:glycoside-pentoside-hexuronide (GPH):cation symporter [Paenibacillus sp. G2S3]|uniref:MFS transporter n=1 Tax=Paenibacillus sp. G2S3 TaxID=3047872 RepID=UPI0024C17EDB|nr:glycoside-pentoside-hexuronide (GPH):cation symporter [Paenibacillus sp. G2S3]WHY16952.1 glycoside-pentoside-hexuronide (GPH):cation symporter [Paenibacillus sp. G2S3]